MPAQILLLIQSVALVCLLIQAAANDMNWTAIQNLHLLNLSKKWQPDSETAAGFVETLLIRLEEVTAPCCPKIGWSCGLLDEARSDEERGCAVTWFSRGWSGNCRCKRGSCSRCHQTDWSCRLLQLRNFVLQLLLGLQLLLQLYGWESWYGRF